MKGTVSKVMKLQTKTLALAYILILAIGTILSLYIPKNEVTASEAIVIPKEAIRLRILANSDKESDQALKRLVRDEVNANITKWVQELADINVARDTLKSKLPEIQVIAEEVVKREGSTQTVNVEFGKVQFPTKLYGQFLYPAGEYEAILISLGEAKGANWWCVLFPPLCFLDFSNGVAVSDGFEEGEVTAQAEEVSEPALTEVDKTVNTNKETVEKIEEAPVKEEKVVQEEVVAEVEVEVEVEVPATEPVPAQEKTEQPVYVAEAEEKVEVKFFLKELWLKLF
jgi:stage II sporulation protein R